MTERAFQEGERLWWYHTLRGGYGYTITVPVTFIKQGKRKATVLADLKDGSQRRTAVDPSKLKRIDANGQAPPTRQ